MMTIKEPDIHHKSPFEGLVCPMLTPFNRNGQIDLETTRRLTDHLIASGVDSLLPCGTTGEGMMLSLQERKSIAEAVVEQTDGRAAVIVHTGSVTTAETITLTKHAREIGADAVSVITPYFYSYSDNELFDHYASVAQSVPDLPISLYAFPGNAKHEISITLFNRLCETFPNIKAIKLSSIDLVRFQEYVQSGGADFYPLCGVDALTLPALSIGSRGQVSGNSNVYPGVFRSLLDAFYQNDLESAQQQQVTINRIRSLFKDNLSYFKAAMRLRGLPVGDPRPPIRSLSENEIRALKAGMETLNIPG